MLDKKYNAKEKEEKWLNYWLENNIYKFKKDNRKVYSVDTPPPTVSGDIHIGHIFSYSQTEMLVRYKRLRGYNVFYPFGFDDNGLPSEKLVEKEIGKKAHELSREEFTKLCYEVTSKYENRFENLFNKMGISTDWDLHYKTISPESIKISQLSFIDLINKKKAYRSKSPALWCTECLTTFSQAELETKTLQGTFNYIKFTTTDNEDFTIATTRPELLPAIVAVVINKEDEKNKHLIGKEAIVPLINIKVPIISDDKVDLEKGTGIVMCCTFGDQTDIEWWNKYHLPLKDILIKDGRLKEEIPKYGGLKIKQAREAIVNDLKTNNYIIKIENIEHEVQTHERCGKEVEYTILDQWFIDLINHKEDFLKLGDQIKWYPNYMKTRYVEWINNLAWDWNISRQRYFGVPIPVWYCEKCNEVILPNEKDLPVNPLKDLPPISRCPKCNHDKFIPDKDVLDTWATSSVTPLINMKYKEKENFEDILKPMSLRTNASDIIRTWDFYTIVKSFYHFNQKPWENVMISGFVMAGKGEKISKSKGNTKLDPFTLIEEYSADVVRYWAASGKLGTDIQFNEETLQRGRKLVNKLYNASKFVEMHLEDYKDQEFNDFEFFDRWILGKYSQMEKEYLNYLDKYEIGLALATLEKFFWNFCDNYLEIVKHRLYRPEEFGVTPRYSGQKTLYIILYKLLQEFSIYFPFVTEEIFKEIYNTSKSIHLTNLEESNFNFDKEIINGNQLLEIISTVRGEKTNKNVTLKTEVETLNLELNNELNKYLNEAIKDFKATLFIKNINITKKEENYKIKDIILNLED